MLISSITEAFLVWLLNESASLYAFNWAFFQIRIWCEIQWQSCHIYWLVFTQLSVYKLYFSYLIISTFRAGNTSFSCVFPSSHLSIYRKFECVSMSCDEDILFSLKELSPVRALVPYQGWTQESFGLLVSTYRKSVFIVWPGCWYIYFKVFFLLLFNLKYSFY